MFEPNEESMVLEIVSNFLDIPSDDMLKIGDMIKNQLFGPGAKSEEEAIEQLKATLQEMPREHVLIAGLFISGLLRCNLAQQGEQQYTQAMTAEEDAAEDGANE